MAKPEEANKKTVKLLAGKAVGKIFHDPEIEFDYEAYARAKKILAGKVFMVNMYQHMGWDTLRGDIIAAASLGCKVVFIDPITNLTNGMESADANVKLQEIAQEAAALALDLNIVIFLFCHLKEPNGGITDDKRQKYYEQGKFTGFTCTHRLGGEVHSSQFAGSRAMSRSCNYMFGLEGNRDEALDEGVRNQRWLKILEDREFGEVGHSCLYWNRGTGLFKEV